MIGEQGFRAPHDALQGKITGQVSVSTFKHLSVFRAAGFLAVSIVMTAARPLATTAQQRPPNPPAVELEVLQVRPSFYMIAGAGSNIAVQIGADGAVVVDAGLAERADAVIAEIRKLTNQPIRYVIDTNADPDHIGGNEKLSRAGESIVPTGGLNNMAAYGGRAPILAEEHVQNRMSAPTGKQSKFPEAAWPTSTYSSASGENRKDIFINSEAVRLFYQPAAHSDADSLVFFRRSDVIVTGDVFDMTRFPVIDIENGGTIQGVIDSLNRVIELAVPAIPLVWQEGGTLVIPGHGRLCSKDDVVNYRDMVTIIRDIVQDQIKKGMSLDEIEKANPTQGYRRRFGVESGAFTTDRFVEVVYKSLAKR
jgi:glyoxylase-like metal-dependent hydrolase (beta-lactamase superfamily II)